MRRGHCFTPVKIKNWIKAGRGTGTFGGYVPWHQIRRGDPSSRGLSHLMNWSTTGRIHHYLSSIEAEVFGFVAMLPGIIDIREQYPLAHKSHPFDISPYSTSSIGKYAEGTLGIAERLGYKHPIIPNGQEKMPWTMSTDLVITLQNSDGSKRLLAISVKHDKELESKRTSQLLQIEQAYWKAQRVEWLLITPSLSLPSIRRTVRMAMSWAIAKSPEQVVKDVHLNHCKSIAPYFDGKPLSSCLAMLQSTINEPLHYLQKVFWQAVWKGFVPIDLNEPLQFSSAIRIISLEAFISQNPILARRSAWA